LALPSTKQRIGDYLQAFSKSYNYNVNMRERERERESCGNFKNLDRRNLARGLKLLFG
jgi:hypothetical protein